MVRRWSRQALRMNDCPHLAGFCEMAPEGSDFLLAAGLAFLADAERHGVDTAKEGLEEASATGEHVSDPELCRLTRCRVVRFQPARGRRKRPGGGAACYAEATAQVHELRAVPYDDQKIAFLALHNPKRPNGTPRVGCRRSPGPESRLLIQLLHVNLLQICCSCRKMKYLMHVLVAGCGTGCDSFLRSAICRLLIRIKSRRWPGEVTTGG